MGKKKKDKGAAKGKKPKGKGATGKPATKRKKGGKKIIVVNDGEDL